MGILKNIREFFWPLLDREEELIEEQEINEDNVNVNTNRIEKTLGYVLNCYESESERKKIVENKASLFIGTISIVTSVVLGVTSVLVGDSDKTSLSIAFLIFLLFILNVYMVRTIWFSIKALERKNYYTLSIDNFLLNVPDEQYYKKLIVNIANMLKKNSKTINSKVDNMTMAQEYFKRAIVIVFLYSLLIFLLFLDFDFYEYSTNLIFLLNSISINGWHVLILYSISLSSLLIGAYLLFRRST